MLTQYPWLHQYLKDRFSHVITAPIKGGASGAGLYRFNREDHEDKILKIVKIECKLDSQQIEVDLYAWLENKLAVPEVEHFDTISSPDGQLFEVIVMTELQGKNLKAWPEKASHLEIAKVYGKALKALHSLPFEDCPVRVNLDDRLRDAAWRLENGHVDEEDFEGQFSGVPAKVLLEELVATKPAKLDLVCAHGDYCLDNLMAKAYVADDFAKKSAETNPSPLAFSGFLDMGRGGVQDRYQDIALAVRSIRKRLGPEFVEPFVEAYELVTELEADKVHYYILLDEFF